MFTVKRTLLALVLSLSVLVPVTLTFAGALDGNYSDPYSYESQRHSPSNQEIRDQARARELQADRERDRQYSDRDKWSYSAPAPHRGSGTDYTNSYNSTSGVFTNCYGSGQTQTCTDTGGR